MRKGRSRRKKFDQRRLDWKVVFIWFLLVLVFIQTLIIHSLWQERRRFGNIRISAERTASDKVSSRRVVAFKNSLLPSQKRKGKKHREPRKKEKRKQILLVSGSVEKRQVRRPYLVIILDDWGYSLKNLPMLKALSLPVDVSILPGHEFSLKVSRIARETGKEVMLHLPMEPDNLPKEKWEHNTITVNMSEDQIRKLVNWAIDSVPGAVGVNNHMGSRATADVRVMRIVLSQVKKRGLFFLDSVSTPATVVKKVCREVGLPYVARDVFIDNQADLRYIKAQIKRAVDLANKKGYAVVIGHDRENTLRALIDMETYLREKTNVIKASDLVRKLSHGDLKDGKRDT